MQSAMLSEISALGGSARLEAEIDRTLTMLCQPDRYWLNYAATGNNEGLHVVEDNGVLKKFCVRIGTTKFDVSSDVAAKMEVARARSSEC